MEHYSWTGGQAKERRATLRQQPEEVRTVFDTRLHDEKDGNFIPCEMEDFQSTEEPAGSEGKIQVLCERVAQGLPLWHPNDRQGYDGCEAGVVKPRQ